MKSEKRFRFINLVGLFIALSTLCQIGLAQENPGQLKFEILFPSSVHPDPVAGRVYVIVSKDGGREPRLQTGFDMAAGIPIWGKNVQGLKPGEAAVIDENVFGFPLESIKKIPAGEYYVQGFINIYTEFKRSDGHTLWMHNDQWEGQRWNISPGNLYSTPAKMFIDPAKGETIRLVCDNVIPPVEVPPDSAYVKRIKFRSEILTKFWGQPIYLGTTVLLPEGYDSHPAVYYPVCYIQGHFSLRAPHGFSEGNPFHKLWTSEGFPRMIAVTFQHPCPYYDDSYVVNSPNVGPYDDAIMQELIPYIEEHFRIIRKPYARVLTGGSTGGWICLAMQVFHPDFFGGTWSLCPDPVDFRYYELINIYDDENAYYRIHNHIQAERPEARDPDGQVWHTVRDSYYYEWTLGDRHRSGGQWAIWEAAYTPMGEGGYPKPLWDWRTGKIDHEVAEHWKKFDLRYYLENNWSWLGPKLAGKLHVYVGDMDTFYLNNAVVLLEKFLEGTKDPYYAGVIKYGDRRPHCWGPSSAEIYQMFKEHILKNAPANEDTSSWNY